MDQKEIKSFLVSFADKYLEGDIDQLSSFNLYKLRDDKEFGCTKRRFDPDDSMLMRNLYVLLFEDTWTELNMKTLDDGLYRGETLNTYNTMFGRPNDESLHPGLDRFNPPKELVEKVDNFQKSICATIGNMMVLPNKRIKVWDDRGKYQTDPITKKRYWKSDWQQIYQTINEYRGCHGLWRDFFDLFLVELHKVLIGGNCKDKYLHVFLSENDFGFSKFKGEEGWNNFIKDNLLEDYTDNNLKPLSVSKGYCYWSTYHMTRELYLEESERYVDFATMVIRNRSKRMIELIKKKLDL